ncbi:3-dehydroquinate synthase [Lottiidibacillus patelloidae]|uniref:3-dehydroquinate synthase n=1 Tax=Lottiidibacillus patelloidae TaxID=2670334 RepID=A0A263BVC2_9BACI|nr:3-dehydroquinate synthase [Lottiidibacillus patelloidae]OZM57277.1 3-dehydroquinate synthase [Lottiidibacillus patelloidae]
MYPLTITTETKTYPIYIGHQLRFQVKSMLQENTISFDKILVITDDNVAPLYLDDVIRSFNSDIVYSYIVKNGEQAKSFNNYIHIQTYAIERNLTRNSLIIALGGGVIGDLAGFVAATFLRGVNYIQMPTTILAHDSAVGGKVAINHDLGKNLIGSFYQPAMVMYDLETLQTLPRRQQLAGFAELIKHALIDEDNSLLTKLQYQSLEQLFTDKVFLSEALYQGMKVKATIVNKDEKEAGIRKYLNFGHTLGHAIESETNYRVLHGEAVIIGMLFALYVSEIHFNKDLNFKGLKSWFEKLGYETHLPTTLNPEDLVVQMKKDKKVTDNQINMVLLEEIGKPTLQTFNDETIKQFLENFYSE